MKKVFSNNFMDMYENEGKYFIEYNTGDIFGSEKTIEINKNDANKIIKNEINPEQIIIKYQNIELGLK